MAVHYELSIMDRGGAEQYRLVGSAVQGASRDSGGFLRLEYASRVNNAGLLTFDADADHEMIAAIDLDWQVAVWRQDAEHGIDPYIAFAGLFRADDRATDRDGGQRWTGICPGYLHFLQRSSVGYRANSANRSKFTSVAAETIAKTLVTYNATSGGTVADGRVRNTDDWADHITVQADGGAGSVIDFACAWDRLLPSLQRLALLGGGDFDLVKVGGQQWEFRWYDGQRGTDRSGEVVFALQYGNMATPRLVRNYMDTNTVVIVGGQGEEAAREIVVRQAADYQSLYRSGEAFYNASGQYSTTGGYQTAGDLWLTEHLHNRVQLTFDVIQTPAYLYGLHYLEGDKITARYQGVEATKKIMGATVSVDPAAAEVETIKLILEDV